MTDNTKNTLIAGTIFSILAVALIGSIILAWTDNNPAWFIIAAIAFCILAAWHT